ncbi:MAG TPA: POTRA domain-containing protein [Polyangiaceae bacterium]|nr:POTRA domain-containing protein [Polyangiaceae bacterium]
MLKVDVVTTGGRWQVRERLRTPLGQPLSAAYARTIAQELLSTGRYADARVSAYASGRGVGLRVSVVPRRVVAQVRVSGGGLDEALILEAAGVAPGDDVTLAQLPEIDARVRALFRRRGFPDATVETEAIDTDEPMRVVLHSSVHAGEPLTVTRRAFEVHPRRSDELGRMIDGYAVDAGGRIDEDELKRADLELLHQLQGSGYRDAAVEHRIEWKNLGWELTVVVWAGAKVRLRFEGNESFDEDELRAALELDADAESTPEVLERKLHEFYVQRGFLDVSVRFEQREASDGSQIDYWFALNERQRVTVRARHFPCLTGERSAADVAAEIDGVLSEALPATGLFGPVDPSLLDQKLAPQSTASQHVTPITLDPWTTYDPGAYDKAIDHVRALYRSEGYLSAEVGPVVVLRRGCDLRSPVGHCIPIGPARAPAPSCAAHAAAAASPNTASASAGPQAAADPWSCVPDLARGKTCEREVELSIPVVLGPRAQLWDIGFEGNRTLVESELHDVTGLELGGPVSQLALEEARRRVVERYAEEGYVFAGVEVDLELSPDRTRAKAKFIISEREPVRVREVVVHGSHFTDTDLIVSRAAIRPGELYRRSLVRATEERLATLGVFTSVTVDLEDPEVPAREKVAVIRVQERLPQYLDVRPGFSTGEGLRIAFEYGHRNLARRAIQLSLRVQLGYLPPPLIIDDELRNRFENLLDQESILFLLERRNSATIEFPEVGLGPLYRLSVEGVDLRDITRDFALEKRAAIATLNYRPNRSITLSFGASLELNEAVFINNEGLGSLRELFDERPNDRLLRQLLNVPEGLTLAISQRLGFTWDRRDNSVAATRGTLLSLNLEHVNAFPIEQSGQRAAPELDEYYGHFLQYTGRVAGYLRLSERGTALATSLRFGLNQQLEKNSSTYPDRLFYLGGVDSLRGFPLWSVIPEDVYRSQIGSSQIPVSGGDLLLNPRLELRVPVFGIWQAGIFLDTGNVWAVSSEVFDSFRLRYSAGLGVRVSTPVGPLALDYGINLDPRPGEDFGAIHFSIGLF